MTDEEKALDEQKKKASEEANAKLKSLTPDELIEIIRETRNEAKENRLAAKELKEKLSKIESEKIKEEEAKLKQKGEIEKLLEAKEKELESIKPKADAFEKLRQDEIADAKKQLGDKWLDEYESLSITALRKTVSAFLVKAKVAGTDNGGADDPNEIRLTPQQKQEAHQKFSYMTPQKAEEAWFDVLKKSGKIK